MGSQPKANKTGGPCAPNLEATHTLELKINEIEIKALLWWKKRWFTTADFNIAHVAHWLLLIALQHPEFLDRCLTKLVEYSEAEDVNQRPYLVDSLRRRKEFKKITIPKFN